MREPLAYHITWTCYGQWLRGDTRGYVDRHHRTPGAPYRWGHGDFRNADANRMRETACWLDDTHRRAAHAAMGEACAFRDWRHVALNVQPDHVHVVVRAPGHTGKQVMQRLKDRATRCLRGLTPGRHRWWTEGGKVELILDERYLRQAVAYVTGRQPFCRVE